MNTVQSGTRSFTRSLLALAAAATASPLLAQETSTALEEVIVTAEHREATLQSTQISMSALGPKAIQELGISNGLDISNVVPNVNAQPYVGGRTGISFNIRGIGNAETLITFDPAVSVYLDGILIAKNTGALLDVVDLKRIEVLRGPQGTLYGRNTMGGAVNYITQKPVDQFEGKAQVTIGNYGERDYRGTLNVPLLGADSAAGELAIKISAASLNRDGIQDNNYVGALQDELGTKNRDVFLGQVQWKPTDYLSVLYAYDRTHIDENPQTVWATDTNPATYFGPQLAPYAVNEGNRPSGGQFDHIQIAETKVDGHALTIGWEVTDSTTLTSLTGYRQMTNFGEGESDGTPLDVLWTRDKQEYTSWSEELRLVGSLGAAFDYNLGAFYMKEDGDVYNETTAAGGSSANVGKYTNKAWAVYGQTTWHITHKLNLTGGARYTKEDREMEKALITGDYPPIFIDTVKAILPGDVYPKAQKNFDNISWLASIGYDWTDDVMTYFKVSTGFQSGGFNVRDQLPQDFTKGFKDETILAYELGLKSRWADRFQVNTAIFYSDYDDKRVNQFDPVNLVSVQRNAGKVKIYGAELEILAQLTEHWQVGANYGFTHKEYVKYKSPTGADLSNDSNFPYSPDNMANAHVSYQHSVGIGVLLARVDWSYRSKMTFLVPQPELNSSKSLQLWNARVTLDEVHGPGDTTFRFSLWGKNLTDEGYYDFGVNIYNSFGFNINTFGLPRTYGFDAEIRF